MYSLLLETYIKDSKEKYRLFNAVESIECVGKKAKWAFNWINRYYTIPSSLDMYLLNRQAGKHENLPSHLMYFEASNTPSVLLQ